MEYLEREYSDSSIVFFLEELKEYKILIEAYDFTVDEIAYGYFFEDYLIKVVSDPDARFDFVEPKDYYDWVGSDNKNVGTSVDYLEHEEGELQGLEEWEIGYVTFSVSLNKCFLWEDDLLTFKELLKSGDTKNFFIDTKKNQVIYNNISYDARSTDIAIARYLKKKYDEGDYSYQLSEDIFLNSELDEGTYDKSLSKLLTKNTKFRDEVLDKNKKNGWRLRLCIEKDNSN